MIFKIVQKSKNEIPVANEEDLMKLLSEANAGKKLVLTKYGVIDVSSIDCIIPHKGKMQEVGESIRYGKKLEEAEAEALGPSPFAKMLAGGMTMLKPGQKADAFDEAGRQLRGGK